MSRKEFTRKTKDAAWERSGGACEGSGPLYGLAPSVRCGDDLTVKGVEYDHIDMDANSKDNSLENCCACCPACHLFKTTKHDIPKAAKTVRQRNAARNIKAPSRGGFRKCPEGFKHNWKTGRVEAI